MREAPRTCINGDADAPWAQAQKNAFPHTIDTTRHEPHAPARKTPAVATTTASKSPARSPATIMIVTADTKCVRVAKG